MIFSSTSRANSSWTTDNYDVEVPTPQESLEILSKDLEKDVNTTENPSAGDTPKVNCR
ncbi:MAG: hypothetical protein AAF215_07695 [Cyanobacteria bacterium P01_A01_bin.123]